MNIIVLLKQVPDLTQLAGPADGPRMLEADAPKVVNPWDEYALETAIQLKEAHGGQVTCLTVGPPQAVEALRTALAMGLDQAVLISDPALTRIDSLATARLLATGIGKLGHYDLIVGGRASIDAAASATAVQVAALLDLPVISYVAELKSVDPVAASVTAIRLLENGRQRVSSRLPALITVVKEINEPRYPSFMGLRQAKKAVIPTWTLADLGLEAGQLKAQVSWQISAAPSREARLEMLQGPPAEAAATLADRLIDDQVI